MSNKIFPLFSSLLVVSVGFALDYPVKIKTVPDFPEGLPPTTIMWDGKEVGLTNPNKSVEIVLNITNEKKVLSVGEDKIILFLKGKNKIEIEPTSMAESKNWKIKKETLVLKKKIPKSKIEENSIEYYKKIKVMLNDERTSYQDKAIYGRLLANIMSYEYITENISVNLRDSDPENGILFLDIAYFGELSVEWQSELVVTEENFSKTGRPKDHPKQVQIFNEHFSKIPKYGILKMNDAGQLELNTIKTKKYKYGTKKGKKKALKKQKKTKKYILPISINSPI